MAASPHLEDGNGPLAAFCDELDEPLEEITNVLYLAAHSMKSAPDHAAEYLEVAQERLTKLHRVIHGHCTPKKRPFDLAS